MKLLVTGGAGFIGSNFVLYWLKKHPDDEVVNFDKLTYAGNLENLACVEKNPQYNFVKGDICNAKDVEAAMKGVDIVVHFAAETHVDRSIMASDSFIKTNVFGTYTLLEQALKTGVKRFHHVSTDEVYGSLNLGDGKKFNEQFPYNPRNPYSASKAASDHLVMAYFHTHGLPVTISNCSNNFGPYQFPEKLIPLTVTNLLEGRKVPVYGDGKYVRDWLYVVDYCRAIETILDKGKIGETYCVGGNTEYINNLMVVRKILGVLNKNDSFIEFVKDRPGHDRKYAIDWGKIKRELDWRPEHDFDVWLVKTVEWYQSNRAWWQNMKSGEYQKYYKKQYG